MKKVFFFLMVSVMCAIPCQAAANDYQRGDCDLDGNVNISDVTTLIEYLLNGYWSSAKATNDYQRGDCDLDGYVNISDVTTLIERLLTGVWSDEPTNPDDHDWVDLGLPSGTLWASCNIGATSPEEFGYYFRWGETRPTPYDSIFIDDYHYKWFEYGWYHSQYGDDYFGVIDIIKYNTNSDYPTVDNKTELDPEDDAATVNWGPNWCMPTKAQIEELITECFWAMDEYSATAYGPNGATLYFPYASRCFDPLFNSPWMGIYWTRNLCPLEEDYWDESFYFQFDGSGAYSFQFKRVDHYNWKGEYLYTDLFHETYPDTRPYARSVRAVRVSHN